MTQQDIEEKFIGRAINEEGLDYYFKMMGKFGKASMYTFSFNTDDYTISAEVCVENGKLVGVVPDKELRDDGWGVNPDAGPAEIQPEEYDTMAMYLNCVVK
ncbi:MAG: hypothetical protein ACI4PM_01020 [Butyricicoccus sp.]